MPHPPAPRRNGTNAAHPLGEQEKGWQGFFSPYIGEQCGARPCSCVRTESTYDLHRSCYTMRPSSFDWLSKFHPPPPPPSWKGIFFSTFPPRNSPFLLERTLNCDLPSLFLDDQLSLPDPRFLRGEGHICSWSERLRRRRRRSKGLNTREEKRLGVSNFHVAKRRGRNRFPASNFPFFSARVSIFFSARLFSLFLGTTNVRLRQRQHPSRPEEREKRRRKEKLSFFPLFPSLPSRPFVLIRLDLFLFSLFFGGGSLTSSSLLSPCAK